MTGETEKRVERLEEEIEKLTPEISALRDNLVRYEIAAASERRERDRLVATWRDVLHGSLKEIGPIDPTRIHKVIDNMDDFLNRAGGRRK
jgi:predicted  nucleic acid-binding Zn-ribbon protein